MGDGKEWKDRCRWRAGWRHTSTTTGRGGSARERAPRSCGRRRAATRRRRPTPRSRRRRWEEEEEEGEEGPPRVRAPGARRRGGHHEAWGTVGRPGGGRGGEGRTWTRRAGGS